MIESDVEFLDRITKLGIVAIQILGLFSKVTDNLEVYEKFYGQGGRLYLHLDMVDDSIGVTSNMQEFNSYDIYARLDEVSKLVMH